MYTLIYFIIFFCGIFFAYAIDFYLINKHYKESKKMVDAMFDDAKKVMVAFLTFISFGLLFKNKNDNNDDIKI